MEVKIVDSYPKGGKRGLEFHYVREDDRLYHVSKYAIVAREASREVIYVVDPERIAGKWIYVFGRTNSGNPCFWKFEADRLVAGEPKYRILQDVTDDELANLELGDHSPGFQQYIRENWGFMVKMREEILGSKLRNLAEYLLAHPGTSCFLDSPVRGYWYCACWPKDSSRLSSISQIMKYVHQVWCALLIIEGLGIAELLTESGVVLIEQGSGWPSVVFRDSKGQVWSAWVEAQWIEGFKPGEWVRADIILAKGDWRGKLAPHNVRGIKADILIECKHEEWTRWWNEKTEKRLRKYREVFQPEHALLVSLRRVPEQVRQRIRKLGYMVFDGVWPGSEGVKKLMKFLRALEQ